MVKKENNVSELVGQAIGVSMEFEEFMDQTDFDSWLKEDKVSGLKKKGQQVTPFRNYKENTSKLRDMCERIVKQKETGRSYETGEESASERLEDSLAGWLFKAKIERLDARITSETRYYIKSIRVLLRGLNHLLNSSDCRNSGEYWLILYYNDLSICYSGLNNSFLSQGYAQEALKIIEKEERYKKFDKEVSSGKLIEAGNLANHPFVSSKLYDLYLVAVFNRAQAERRSYQRNEAERDFRIIIDYVRRSRLTNFNYYSAIVGLGDLYIEQGRGKEAIDFLREVIEKTDEDDIRHWKASLTMIGALVDQSEYDGRTQELLGEFITKSKNGCPIPKPKHRLTYAGFKGLELRARCDIERVSDNPKMSMKERELELQIPTKFLGESIGIAQRREQKGFEQKAYKYLGAIHAILEKDSGIKENLARFVSRGEIGDLYELIKQEVDETGNYINECEDLDVLESLSEQVCELLGEGKKPRETRTFLRKIVERIKRECADKDCLARAEKTIRITHEFLEEDGRLKNLPFVDSTDFKKKKSELFCSKDPSHVSPKNMRRRLDANEKEFDKLLLGRHEGPNHVVEVIVLRRWNSFSPGLSRRLTESLGGGYLLRISGSSPAVAGNNKKSTENIVIDPGYDFLQNLCGEGFSVEDIDTIIVTHSHLDHCSELRPIMDLIFQINKRNENSCRNGGYRKKVNLCLSPGVYRKFSSYIEDWREQLKDVVILDPLREEEWKHLGGLSISAIKTHHVDLGYVYAMGLRIEIQVSRDNTTKEPQLLSLGFTGDTHWYPGIRDDFKRCDLLCVHLGTIKYQEIGYTANYHSEKDRDIPPNKQFKEVKELYAERAEHLLCFGAQDVIASCADKNTLVIVGEFGEEMKYGLRKDLCRKFNRSTEAQCIPGDIGLRVRIEDDRTKKIRCTLCEEFVGRLEINTFSHGREDALQYICHNCKNTLSPLQQEAIIDHKLTRH